MFESGMWTSGWLVVVGDSDSDRRTAGLDLDGVSLFIRKHGLDLRLASMHTGPSSENLIHG